MSYKVDSKTLLFTDLTESESDGLEFVCEQIVLNGATCWRHPAFLVWIEAAGYDERQSLLVMATAFPQRALLSLLRRS